MPTLTIQAGEVTRIDPTPAQWGATFSLPATPATVSSPDCSNEFTFTYAVNSESVVGAITSFTTRTDANGDFFYEVGLTSTMTGSKNIRVVVEATLDG